MAATLTPSNAAVTLGLNVTTYITRALSLVSSILLWPLLLLLLPKAVYEVNKCVHILGM